MLQKTGGQEKYAEKSKGDINIEDVGTIVNCIVIETMHIYLHGGFEKLKEVLKWLNQPKVIGFTNQKEYALIAVPRKPQKAEQNAWIALMMTA